MFKSLRLVATIALVAAGLLAVTSDASAGLFRRNKCCTPTTSCCQPTTCCATPTTGCCTTPCAKPACNTCCKMPRKVNTCCASACNTCGTTTVVTTAPPMASTTVVPASAKEPAAAPAAAAPAAAAPVVTSGCCGSTTNACCDTGRTRRFSFSLRGRIGASACCN